MLKRGIVRAAPQGLQAAQESSPLNRALASTRERLAARLCTCMLPTETMPLRSGFIKLALLHAHADVSRR